MLSSFKKPFSQLATGLAFIIFTVSATWAFWPSGGSSSGSSNSGSSSSNSSSSSASKAKGKFSKIILKAHNDYRKKHSAGALVWDKKIAKVAKAWAKKLAKENKMYHSKGSGYGENLYMSYGAGNDPAAPVNAWYSEIKDYNFDNPNMNTFSKWGHFTQVVWTDSKKLGCGQAKSKSGSLYVCCNYSPPGNYNGAYKQKVKKK